jgi:transcriptional regulator of arginine metabolism
MAERSRRQEIILEVIARKLVRTQQDLLKELRRRGIELTQATLSRELKSLGVSKGPDGRGGYRYVAGAPASGLSGQLPAVATFVRSVERSNNLLVVKTPPGNAQGVARGIDQAEWSEVLGTIAGDDTILLICRNQPQATRVERRLKLIARQ